MPRKNRPVFFAKRHRRGKQESARDMKAPQGETPFDVDVVFDFSTEIGSLYHEGYLKKQGDHHKSWKKRWFEMDRNFIHYFKSNKVFANFLFLAFLAHTTQTLHHRIAYRSTASNSKESNR